MLKLDNRNIKSLDGLRGYSILLVILSHYGLGQFVPGGVGVTVFFFVSGFLICKLLLFELHEQNTIHFKAFYLRRIFRLYPALVFFILCVISLYVFVDQTIPMREMIASLFYFTNYNMVYLRDGGESLIGVFNIIWSLSIEEHFYLIFPLTLCLLYKKSNLIVAFCVFVLFVCLAFRLYYASIFPFHIYENYNYHLTHTRMDSIMYGCLAAFLLYSTNLSDRVYSFFTNYFVLGFSVALMLFTLIFRSDYFRETYRYSLQGLALISIVMSVVYDRFGRFNVLFSNKFIVFIGRLSYSLYLFHWIARFLAVQFYPKFTLGWFVIALPVTIALSLFSYYLVEMPFVGLRKKFGSNV